MNSRKIKTSRTFYGKSDVSDPLATPRAAALPQFGLAILRLFRRFDPEVSQKKAVRSAAKMPNFPDIF